MPRDPLAKARRLHKPAKPLLDRILDTIDGETEAASILSLVGALTLMTMTIHRLPDNPDVAKRINDDILDVLGRHSR